MPLVAKTILFLTIFAGGSEGFSNSNYLLLKTNIMELKIGLCVFYQESAFSAYTLSCNHGGGVILESSYSIPYFSGTPSS